jgi:predicted phage terminase large subunit-like protein
MSPRMNSGAMRGTYERGAGVHEPKDVITTILGQERAKARLIDFAQFVDDIYRPYAVHRLIASKLESVEAGAIRRLAIFVPPAVGKSKLASELFPAWVLGRNPNFEIIEASYNKDKAAEFGMMARDTVASDSYKLLFPDTEVSPAARAADAWKTTNGGSYKASGTAGGIIGFHAHIAIIDDPFKNFTEAASAQNRQEVWDWYSAVLLNRLRAYKGGSGAVVLIMQRWHDDDLGGRLEKIHDAGDEEWDIVSIPSLAEENDPLGREIGEALLPEGPNMRPVEELYAIRARNPGLFIALHQQKPVSDEGDMFKPSWLIDYVPDELPSTLTYYGASDWALSEGSGDFTVHVVFGVDHAGHVWIVDIFRGQVDILEGVTTCVDLMLKYKPLKWFSERVMMSKAIGPVLRKRKVEVGAWTLMEDVSVIGFGGKESPSRAGAFAGACQAGYVHIPAYQPWIEELKFELSRFPKGKHDDQVDACALIGMNLNKLRGARSAPVQAVGPAVIVPTLNTFSYLMDRAKQRRWGIAPRKESIVIPPVDEPLLPDTAVN